MWSRDGSSGPGPWLIPVGGTRPRSTLVSLRGRDLGKSDDGPDHEEGSFGVLSKTASRGSRETGTGGASEGCTGTDHTHGVRDLDTHYSLEKSLSVEDWTAGVVWTYVYIGRRISTTHLPPGETWTVGRHAHDYPTPSSNRGPKKGRTGGVYTPEVRTVSARVSPETSCSEGT